MCSKQRFCVYCCITALNVQLTGKIFQFVTHPQSHLFVKEVYTFENFFTLNHKRLPHSKIIRVYQTQTRHIITSKKGLNNYEKKSKRLVALLLSLLLVISMIPTTRLTVEAAAKPKLAKKSVSIVVGGSKLSLVSKKRLNYPSKTNQRKQNILGNQAILEWRQGMEPSS